MPRKPVRPSFRFKLVYPDGYMSEVETRKDIPPLTAAAWKKSALKELDELRARVERYDDGESAKAVGNDPVARTKEQR